MGSRNTCVGLEHTGWEFSRQLSSLRILFQKIQIIVLVPFLNRQSISTILPCLDVFILSRR